MTRPLPFPEQPKDPVVQRRLDNLERRSLTRPQIDQQPTAGGDTIRVGWAVDGVLSAGTSRAMPFGPGDSYSLDYFTATLDVPDSVDDVELSIRRNGIELMVVPIPQGDTFAEFAVGESYADGDLYTVAITEPGTDAEGLQTFARFVGS